MTKAKPGRGQFRVARDGVTIQARREVEYDDRRSERTGRQSKRRWVKVTTASSPERAEKLVEELNAQGENGSNGR